MCRRCGTLFGPCRSLVPAISASGKWGPRSCVPQSRKRISLVSKMKSLAGMRWASFGSPDMQVYEEMKSPMDSQGVAQLRGSTDLSRPWVSLGKICRKGSAAGWVTSTGPNGKVSVIPNDRLESLSRDLTWAHERNSWPLIGFNPGL